VQEPKQIVRESGRNVTEIRVAIMWNPGRVVGSPYSTTDLGFCFLYGFRCFTQREQGYERKEGA